MITFLLSGTESFLEYSFPDDVDDDFLAGMKISEENVGCCVWSFGVGVARLGASEATEAA